VAGTVTKCGKIQPNGTSEVNLEFPMVTGPKIDQIKDHQESVVEAQSAR
jgi:hypothetical protein